MQVKDEHLVKAVLIQTVITGSELQFFKFVKKATKATVEELQNHQLFPQDSIYHTALLAQQ